ncbi:MAG: amidohydrolase family protein, partial [Oscillospiraceae bacterium]|nr:amidohydrolase family protein [Oscillospiraceae bacterium]
KILGHSHHFWAEITKLASEEERNGPQWSKVIPGTIERLMRECPNLYGDLSAGSGGTAMMRDPEYAAKFMTEFSDRLLYGTDICEKISMKPGSLPYDFGPFLDNMAITGMISMDVYNKIVRYNAIKLLNLDME